MNAESLLYIGTITLMLAVFAALAFRAYRKDRKDEVESPKHRMLDD